ncbi:AfsR/SARP family transcriptional regulator [Crossiella cryophila]|uniref:DNA-binding SARP family transcriptional activator/Tfp pilus assembly protein PilF n=1 Tax=Crossiella cryophila TaxID=43355 RepID=A0A7W7C6E3_9PSEU|nr:BTAD domain-containing putative transcriptional regulator [Crossiella cryophila]MBB4675387.1 DNA-binding SARP family transcriptional activator/Tfp pilus assembly protein PilF [Crossiella cryophila]
MNQELLPPLEFRVLGPVELVVGGTPLPMGRAGARCLLALLALEVNQVVGHDRIQATLWEDEPPPTARTVVHGHVSRLRRVLTEADPAGSVTLITHASGYLLRADPRLVDLHRARALITAARGEPAAHRRELLSEAVRLWRGPVLSDVPSSQVLRDVAPELEELRLVAVEEWIQAELDLGRHGEVVVELQRLVAEQPFRERLVGQLVLALYRSGRRADALGSYQSFRVRLVDELGIDPGPTLQELHRQVLTDELAPDPASQQRALAPPSALPSVPVQLPPAPAGFTGRSAELAWLNRLVGMADGPRIAVLAGTAGVGKSALALTWAQRAAAEFPDGQLYASLRGFDPEHAPVDPAEVLRHFLVALGVRPESVPAEFDERLALYRSTIAGRRMLVLLDDAHDSDQVRPLLPTSGAFTVVTSRRRLDGLVVTNGARVLPLDTLSMADTVQLINRVAGERHSEHDLAQVRRLAELCGNLPLALRIAAARLAVNPEREVGDLVEELADEHERLAALDVEETDTSVRGAFDLSYRDLPPPHATVFRLLGGHPGRDVSPYLMATMAEVGVAQARRSLRALAAAHLVIEHEVDRFSMHDLMRLYARALFRNETEEKEREGALRGLLDYYLVVADRARRLMRPILDDLRPGLTRPHVRQPTLNDRQQALAFFDAEWANLTSVVVLADESGQHEAAWQLPTMLNPYLDARFPWEDAVKVNLIGLEAARLLGNRWGEVRIHTALGMIHGRRGLPELSLHHDSTAYRIAEEIGDLASLALLSSNMTQYLYETGRKDEAVESCRRAIELSRRIGNFFVLPIALTNMAEIAIRHQDHEQALVHLREALDIYRDSNNNDRMAIVLGGMGDVSRDLGRLDEAERYYRDAVAAAEAAGSKPQEARMLMEFGEVLISRGDPTGARVVWQRSLELYEVLRLPELEVLRDRLAKLG